MIRSSTVIDQGDGITFPVATYSFSIKWRVDFTALDGFLESGDYFTFSVPSFLAGKTMSLVAASGETLGALTTDASGNGSVTFNENIAGLTNVGGSFTLSASYGETTANVPVTWEFKFGDETYLYEGKSSGTEPSHLC